jgi:hypothetical protein
MARRWLSTENSMTRDEDPSVSIVRYTSPDVGFQGITLFSDEEARNRSSGENATASTGLDCSKVKRCSPAGKSQSLTVASTDPDARS